MKLTFKQIELVESLIYYVYGYAPFSVLKKAIRADFLSDSEFISELQAISNTNNLTIAPDNRNLFFQRHLCVGKKGVFDYTFTMDAIYEILNTRLPFYIPTEKECVNLVDDCYLKNIYTEPFVNAINDKLDVSSGSQYAIAASVSFARGESIDEFYEDFIKKTGIKKEEIIKPLTQFYMHTCQPRLHGNKPYTVIKSRLYGST